MTSPPYRYTAWMDNVGINIYSNSKTLERLWEVPDIQFYIPGWKINNSKAKRARNLYFIESRRYYYLERSNRIYIWGNAEEMRNGQTFPYLVHYFLEKDRIQLGKLTTHGAAVAKGNEGILIIGKQGSGKTSLTLELCRRYGYSLIGNDLVLVGFRSGYGYAYNGTKFFRVRLSTVKQYNQDLKQFFNNNPREDPWTVVARILPHQLNIRVQKSSVRITKIILLHLTNDVNDRLICKKPDKLLARLYLNELFSSYIRGTTIVPLVGETLNYGFYLPPQDDEKAFRKRKKFIDWIITNSQFVYLSGPMKKLVAYLNNENR